MHYEQRVLDGLYWIGGDDRRLDAFEGLYPIPAGISYNSYLLLDEKTVLFDTVDKTLSARFLDTLEYLLEGRTLDCLVLHHLEPDHSATLAAVIARYPKLVIYCTRAAQVMIGQFFETDYSDRIRAVDEGDTLECGSHTLVFAAAPMVHWPEVMVTFDMRDGILFSADAFGTFGALGGRLFADEYDFERELLDEARRYYTNIVGKYGTQVGNLLDKADTLDIKMLCPLHGPVWRTGFERLIEKYRTWASYEPEDQGVVIAYASIYGATQSVAERLAYKLSDAGIHDLALYDLSVTDPSFVLSEAFRASNLVLASVTYNAGIFPKMETLLAELAEHNLQGRSVSLIENGSWGPHSGKLMHDAIARMKGMRFVGELLTINSCMIPEQDAELDALAREIAASVRETRMSAPPVEVREVVVPAALPGARRPPAAAAQPVMAGAGTGADTHTTAAHTMPPSRTASPARTTSPAHTTPPHDARRAAGSAADGSAGAARPPIGASGDTLPPIPGADAEMEIVRVFKCTFCGYEVTIREKELPEDYQCPLCLRGPEQFMLVREKYLPVGTALI